MLLMLPKDQSVNALIAGLCPKAPVLRVADAIPLDKLGTCYATAMLTRGTRQAAGLMIADLHATAGLAGELMMAPPAGLADQVRRGDASPMLLDAISEVFNNLLISLNETGENPHQVCEGAQTLDKVLAEPSFAWVGKPVRRVDFCGDFPTGRGRLVFLAR